MSSAFKSLMWARLFGGRPSDAKSSRIWSRRGGGGSTPGGGGWLVPLMMAVKELTAVTASDSSALSASRSSSPPWNVLLNQSRRLCFLEVAATPAGRTRSITTTNRLRKHAEVELDLLRRRRSMVAEGGEGLDARRALYWNPWFSERAAWPNKCVWPPPL